MRFFLDIYASLLFIFTLARAIPFEHVTRQTVPSSQCVSGVHIIVARGTTEARGEGLMGIVAKKILKHVPHSDSHGLPYPAKYKPTYMISEQRGRQNLTRYIKEYIQSCPDARLVLLGYSQGAQVVADTLCGTSEEDFPKNAPLPMEYGRHVKASIWYGDPSHVAGLSWDFGTSKKDGLFPRQDNSACKPYASILRSYCDHGDIYCASGTNLGAHFGYFEKYSNASAQFVASLVS